MHHISFHELQQVHHIDQKKQSPLCTIYLYGAPVAAHETKQTRKHLLQLMKRRFSVLQCVAVRVAPYIATFHELQQVFACLFVCLYMSVRVCIHMNGSIEYISLYTCIFTCTYLPKKTRECRALLRECRALLRECRAHLSVSQDIRVYLHACISKEAKPSMHHISRRFMSCNRGSCVCMCVCTCAHTYEWIQCGYLKIYVYIYMYTSPK